MYAVCFALFTRGLLQTMVASLKPGPLIRLQEYNITDGAGKISQRAPEMDGTDVKVLTEGIGLTL